METFGRVIDLSGRKTLSVIASLPAHYSRDIAWGIKGRGAAADRYTLLSPTLLAVNIGGMGFVLPAQRSLALSAAASWDTIAGTDYTVAANRAGKDFYVYACQQGGSSPALVVSANSTVPIGYTAANSRKIAGFHCLCADVGPISGHALTGFVAGDILPDSVWDLSFRPACSPEGMVYDAKSDLWVDIYLTSGTGASTASAYNATITDNRNWMDFVDDLGTVGKRLLTDHEFQLAAAGSNERTNITGSADPVTTGGHVDTAGRRMISDIGLEDACGVMWQWLLDQSYRFNGAANHTHTENTAATYTQNASTGNPSGDVAPGEAYYSLPGSKGSLYRQGTYGDVKLVAGGYWALGTHAGSRGRCAIYYRWFPISVIGARGCARSREK